MQCLFICVCAGTISLEIFQPYCTVIQRRGRRLSDSFIYTLPLCIHPNNLFIHSAICRSLFVEIHSCRHSRHRKVANIMQRPTGKCVIERPDF